MTKRKSSGSASARASDAWRRGAALVAVVAGLLLPAAAGAEGPAAVGLAIVDFTIVRREAAAAKSIAQQLEAFVNAYQGDIEREEAALRDAQEELSARRPMLSAEAYAEERHRWEQAVAQAQRRFMLRRQALDRARAEAWQRIEETLNQLIRDIAAERGLSVVLRRDQAVFVVPSLEITEEVLRRLDQILPSVPIAIPES